MNTASFRPRLLGSSVLLAVAMALAATLPALADASTVTQSVVAGSLSASVANLALNSGVDLFSSNVIQTPTGILRLTADDSRGGTAGLGWSVSIVTSAFVYTGTAGGANIPAANFALTSAALPVATAGQVVDLSSGPKAVVTTATLETARKVITAAAAFGQGSYTQDLGVALTVPASSKVGTYTGTLTTTASTTP